MKILLAILLFAAVSSNLPAAEPPVGDWEGTLHLGPADLRLRLHITAGSSGGLAATMDSVDQGAMGMNVDEITLKDHTLRFSMKKINGSYQGTLDAGFKLIKGTWTQNASSFPLDFAPFAAKANPATAGLSELEGSWQGALDTGIQKLRLVLNLKPDGNAGLVGTLDSPDQGVRGIPTSDFVREGRKFSFGSRVVNGTFEGELDPALTTMTGKWKQNTADLPLVLTRMKPGEKLEEPKRTQVPVKPYPYDELEVKFDNKTAQGVTLAGTLTIPRGAGPFPVVVTITGSGPQDRDESLLGHKPFLVIADYLTRHGIAVLRYDDRGTAQSTGNFAAATSADFATDAEAAIDFLKTQPKIDAKHIGLLGHSEGGLIAPMVAARRSDVAFIVLLAPTSITGDKVLLGQGRAIAAAAGHPQPEEVSRQSADLNRAIANGASDDEIRVQVRALLATTAGKEPEPAAVEMQMRMITSPWLRFFFKYDPAPALEKVKCPVLALFGEKDLQVLPADNLEPLKAALARGGNTRVKVELVPKANHLFQLASTGGLDEYARIEETIQPVVLKEIGDWVSNTCK